MSEEKAFLVNERWHWSSENRDYVAETDLEDDENTFVEGYEEGDLQSGSIVVLRKTTKRVRGTAMEVFYWKRIT